MEMEWNLNMRFGVDMGIGNVSFSLWLEFFSQTKN